MTENKKPTTITERLDALETFANHAGSALTNQNKALDTLVENIKQALFTQKEVIDVLIEELDSRLDKTLKTSLNARVEALRLERLKQIAEQEAAQVKAAVEQGVLAPVEAVAVDSILVGRPTKDEVVLGAGRITVEMSSLDKAIAEQLVGKKVGDKWTSPDGSVLEVLEIYSKLPPKPIQAETAEA